MCRACEWMDLFGKKDVLEKIILNLNFFFTEKDFSLDYEIKTFYEKLALGKVSIYNKKIKGKLYIA